MSWKPIETAPKDGTRFLILLGGHDRPYSHAVVVGSWTVLISRPKDSALSEYEDIYGWQIPPYGDLDTDFAPPTHWMPFPPPPPSIRTREFSEEELETAAFYIMGLTVRVHNVLEDLARTGGPVTPSDVAAYGAKRLLARRNFGKHSLAFLRAALKRECGLTLAA